MQPELVLAGPDQRSPAIEAETGNPVTIEELLRRRGLVAYGGNMRFSPLPQGGVGDGAMSGASGVAQGAGGVGGSGATGAYGGVGGTANGMGAATADEIPPDLVNTFSTIEGVAGVGNADSWIEELVALGALGAGAAALYQLWKRRRGRTPSGPDGGTGGTGLPSAPPGAGGDGSGGDGINRSFRPDDPALGMRPDADIIDGEFTEERGLPRPATPLGANDNTPTTIAGALSDQRRGAGGGATMSVSDVELARAQETIAQATRYRDAATGPGVREYWQQVINDVERRLFGFDTRSRVDPNMGRGQTGFGETADIISPRNPAVVPNVSAIENMQGSGRRDRAALMQERGSRAQPNDMDTIPMGEDLNAYTEEEIRQANAIADELIAQRIRGQRSVARGRRRAGTPSAPVYAPNSNMPVTEQRPALVNEILRVLRRGIVR